MTKTLHARARWRAIVVPVKSVVVLVLVSVLSAGCTSERTAPPAYDLAWVAREVPQHPGVEGRNVLRDATWCDDAWWLVGGVHLDEPTETRDTPPAACVWTSKEHRS